MQIRVGAREIGERVLRLGNPRFPRANAGEPRATARQPDGPKGEPLPPCGKGGAVSRAPFLRYQRRMPGDRRLERCCLRCGEAFFAQRNTARYCSNACRQMAYLDRRQPAGVGLPPTLADLDRLIWRPPPLSERE
jgi:hypothetical protein